jgi:hypothetical protein
MIELLLGHRGLTMAHALQECRRNMSGEFADAIEAKLRLFLE